MGLVERQAVLEDEREVPPCSAEDRVLESLKKVLIVEDEEDIVQLLEYAFRKHGFLPLAAYDGLAALDLIEQERPALVLLDILLPKIDGLEVCRLMRGHHDELIAATPVIMLSALGSPEDREKGLRTGANAYMPKPYSVREVVQVAKQLLAGDERDCTG